MDSRPNDRSPRERALADPMSDPMEAPVAEPVAETEVAPEVEAVDPPSGPAAEVPDVGGADDLLVELAEVDPADAPEVADRLARSLAAELDGATGSGETGVGSRA